MKFTIHIPSAATGAVFAGLLFFTIGAHSATRDAAGLLGGQLAVVRLEGGGWRMPARSASEE